MGIRIVLAIGLIFSFSTYGQDRSPAGQAKWMLERLTGVKWPSDTPALAQMTALIQNGDAKAAARVAMQQSPFISVTVKEMASMMSTREETVAIPLNDFSAMIMGVVRDGSDARELLYGNFSYQVDPDQIPAGVTLPIDLNTDILLSNNHYAALERSNLDAAKVLKRVDGQKIATSDTENLDSPDPAGVLTSHAFLGAHAVAGTNRRLVEFTFRQFMCTPIIGWADTLAPDIRIGRDIDRVPGGDPAKFQNTCKGCHTVMDGFRGAFAKWDFQPGLGSGGNNPGGAVHALNGVTTGEFQPLLDSATRPVMRKMNRPDFIQYSGGYITTDDSFINNATRGINATRFGWRGLAPDASAFASNSGGVHALGRLVANSQQFSRCWAQRVFAGVCKHELALDEADALYASLALSFESQGYNLQKLFEAAVTHPKCRL